MDNKQNILIDTTLYNEIKDFCLLNDKDMSEYVSGLLKRAYLNDLYGDAPFLRKKENKVVENTPIEVKIEEAVLVEEKKETLKEENKQENKITVKPKRRRLK